MTDRPRIGHGPNCVYCSSTRGPASCPALPPGRPRIRPRPGRVVVLRDDERSDYPWEVWVGWTFINWFITHAEAITTADKLARRV